MTYAVLLNSLGEFGTPEAVAIEACCGASNFASELRRMTDWDVRQAHPGYVAQLRECKDKTSQRYYSGDCQLLASVALLSNRHSSGDDSLIQRARMRLLLGINEQGSQKVLKGRTLSQDRRIHADPHCGSELAKRMGATLVVARTEIGQLPHSRRTHMGLSQKTDARIEEWETADVRMSQEKHNSFRDRQQIHDKIPRVNAHVSRCPGRVSPNHDA